MKKKLNCVLLIDDDPATNFLNRKVIEKAGVAEHIQVVLNGKEALDYLNNKIANDVNCSAPSLILLDINMPVMDGWEFLAAFKNLKEKQNINPVIVMLTTSSNPDDKRKAEQIEEVTTYKNKPLRVEMIKTIVEEHFQEHF